VPQQGEFGGVVLRVPVGVEHEFLRGTGESAPQRPAVAAILRVVDHADFRVRPRQLIGHLGRVVRTAVIHDDDLEVVGQQLRCGASGDDEAPDGAAVVIGGKKNAESSGHRCSFTFYPRRRARAV